MNITIWDSASSFPQKSCCWVGVSGKGESGFDVDVGERRSFAASSLFDSKSSTTCSKADSRDSDSNFFSSSLTITLYVPGGIFSNIFGQPTFWKCSRGTNNFDSLKFFHECEVSREWNKIRIYGNI
jgi:hypothetical protein